MDYAQFIDEVANKPTRCCHCASLVSTCHCHPKWRLVSDLLANAFYIRHPASNFKIASVSKTNPSSATGLSISPTWEDQKRHRQANSCFQSPFLHQRLCCFVILRHSSPSMVILSSTWTISPKSPALRHSFDHSWKIPPENSFCEDACSQLTLPASLLKGRQ